MKRRVLGLIIVSILIVVTAGCGSNKSSGGNKISDKGNDAQVSIEDIDYSIDSAVFDGKRRVAFAYTNNSKYTIQSVEIKHKIKEDVTDEQMKDQFSTFLESDEDVDDMKEEAVLVAKYAKEVPAGETSSKNECTIGFTFVSSMEQYDCFEPDLATIVYVGDDGKLYTEYYDYAEGEYSQDEEGVDPSQWGTGEKAKFLPKPEDVIITDLDESDSYYTFTASNATLDSYKKYVEEVVKLGFTEGVSQTDTWYSADSKDGKYNIDVNYYDEEGELSVSLYDK